MAKRQSPYRKVANISLMKLRQILCNRCLAGVAALNRNNKGEFTLCAKCSKVVPPKEES